MAYVSMIDAACLRPYTVYLKFKDGTEGAIDLDAVVGMGGVFDPLADINFFSKMKFDPELGSIAWPNGADLSPHILYEKIKQSPTEIAVY